MAAFLRRFLHNDSGSVVAIAVVAVFVLIGAAALAVDVSRYLIVKSKFRTALDSALLAGASVARERNVEQVVNEFFHANMPENYMGTNLTTSIKVTTDPVNFSWTATVDAEMATLFARMIGIDKIDLLQKVSVMWDISRQVDVAFTINTSTSMCLERIRGKREDGTFVMSYRPDPQCNKLNAMKDAMHFIIEHGFQPIEGVGGPVYNVGLIPYNHKVKFPDPRRVPEELLAIERDHTDGNPDYYRDFSDAEPLQALTPLRPIASQADKNYLLTQIDLISQTPYGSGWVRSNIAVLSGALMLDPDYHTYFNGAMPGVMDPMKSDKVLVMMTDGANIGCCYAAYPEDHFSNQYLYLYAMDNAHLTGYGGEEWFTEYAEGFGLEEVGLCDRLKTAGVTIYSVVFDVDDRDPGGKEIKRVYEDCASNQQFFFDVDSAPALVRAYQTIASSFNRLRITY